MFHRVREILPCRLLNRKTDIIIIRPTRLFHQEIQIIMVDLYHSHKLYIAGNQYFSVIFYKFGIINYLVFVRIYNGLV